MIRRKSQSHRQNFKRKAFHSCDMDPLSINSFHYILFIHINPADDDDGGGRKKEFI